MAKEKTVFKRDKEGEAGTAAQKKAVKGQKSAENQADSKRLREQRERQELIELKKEKELREHQEREEQKVAKELREAAGIKEPEETKSKDKLKNKTEKITIKKKKISDNKKASEKKTAATKKEKKKKSDPEKADDLPANAVYMQSTPKHKAAIRRRKITRLFRRVGALVLVVSLLIVIVSGYYKTIMQSMGDVGENIVIALRAGEKFPLQYSLSSYRSSSDMSGAVAVLDSEELFVISSKGSELLRLRHGYVNPGVSAGESKLVLFNIGGKDYSVQGRTKTVYNGKTEDSILFAKMSSGGNYAVFSSNGTQSRMNVYSGVAGNETPEYTWTPLGVIPVVAEFYQDNKTLAVGCVYPEGGTLNTALYVLNGPAQAAGAKEPILRVAGLMPLQIHFLSSTRILVIFLSGYAAIYDAKGTELNRFEYGNKSLVAAESKNGRTALVFGGEEGLDIVLLNNALETTAQHSVAGEGTVALAMSPSRLFVLAGQRVLEYNFSGKSISETYLENIGYGLVYGDEVLVFTAVGVEKLDKIGKLENTELSSG